MKFHWPRGAVPGGSSSNAMMRDSHQTTMRPREPVRGGRTTCSATKQENVNKLVGTCQR